MQRLESFFAKLHSYDLSALLLRLALGGLMLMHGIHKLKNGIGGIEKMLVNNGLPEFMAYGTYIGEIFSPALLILGLYTRLNALVIALTMVVAIYVAYGSKLLALTPQGGLLIELPLLFLVGAIALILMGGGKWGLSR